MTTDRSTPVPRSSSLTDCETPWTACLVAEYTASRGTPIFAAAEAMLITWPEPRASIAGSASFMPRMTP